MPALLLAALLSGFATQNLRVDGDLVALEVVDLDGDGRSELLAVYKTGIPPRVHRWMAVFWQASAGRFAPTPSILEAPAGGRVLRHLRRDRRRRTGAFAHRRRRHRRLPHRRSQARRAAHEDPRSRGPGAGSRAGGSPQWNLCRDWTGDGKLDLLVPDVGRTRLYKRGDAGFEHVGDQRVWPDAYYRTGGGSSYGPFSNRNLSIQVTHVLPTLVRGEYDGDGKPDLFAILEDRVQVFAGTGSGFAFRPKAGFNFRVRTEKEHTVGNVYVQSQARDLDGDGLDDLIVNKVGGGVMGMKSETRIYRNTGGGFPSLPDQRFQADGFSALIRLWDLDGDGKPEMLVGAIEWAASGDLDFVGQRGISIQSLKLLRP